VDQLIPPVLWLTPFCRLPGHAIALLLNGCSIQAEWASREVQYSQEIVHQQQ
jgi:hypothetical protein